MYVCIWPYMYVCRYSLLSWDLTLAFFKTDGWTGTLYTRWTPVFELSWSWHASTLGPASQLSLVTAAHVGQARGSSTTNVQGLSAACLQGLAPKADLPFGSLVVCGQ